MEYLDRTRPLIDGAVRPAGLDFTYQQMQPNDLFRRVALFDEFDGAEMSTSTYLNLVGRGDRRYIALPIFLSRNFRHGYIFVNRQAAINRPEDLAGKRIGTPEYQMTASVWQRAMLQHDYGVSPNDVTWVEGAFYDPSWEERNPIPPPNGVTIEKVPPGKWIDRMLAEGEVDAVIAGVEPPSLRSAPDRVGRLFPNWPEVEQDYYRRTKIFPIMHLVVIRRSVYEQHRWIPMALFNAFVEAQRIGWQRMREPGWLPVMLPWLTRDLAEIESVFGPEHWPYGFTKNRHVLEAFCTYHHEQGLSPRRFAPEELFAEETFTT